MKPMKPADAIRQRPIGNKVMFMVGPLVEAAQELDPDLADLGQTRRQVMPCALIGHADLLRLIEHLDRVAATEASVLIQGESGTGKTT